MVFKTDASGGASVKNAGIAYDIVVIIQSSFRLVPILAQHFVEIFAVDVGAD